MVDRPGIVVRLLGRIFFHWVKFDEVRVAALKAQDQEGVLVYVMNRRSLLDYMYFQWAFLKEGLPLARFANGFGLIHALFIRRVRQMLGLMVGWILRRVHVPSDDRVMLREVIARGEASLLFLRPARGLVGWRAGESTACLDELLLLQKTLDRPLLLVPQFLIWERKPDRYRKSLVDLVFGHPDAPGRVRKLINFTLNHRQAFVHVGDAVNLQEFLKEHAERFEGPALVAQLRWRLNHQFLLEAKVVKGPLIKDARRIRSELMRNETFREDLERIAEETGRSPEWVRKRAQRYLKELAADFQIWVIELFSVLLALLWNRIYEGVEVDEAGLDRLRSAAKKAPLIVVPMHRSHVDYLVVTYLFYHHGLITPHIAAGQNLNFFPMGWLFRASGAFFIRRSFKHNPVYSLVFRYYLRKLVKEGYWIEFFPEGGRSRTGKPLAPRLGLVSDLMGCVEDRVSEDLYFCPVSIGYEKVIEENVYSRELRGDGKKAESVGEILKASKVLTARYGRVYVRFSEPISAREFLDRWGSKDDEGTVRLTPKNLKRFGYTLIHGMNDAAIVSPSSLVATVLLAHPRDGISRSQLVLRVGYLAAYAVDKGAPLSETLQHIWNSRREQLDSPPAEAGRERGSADSLTWGIDLYRARLLAPDLDDVVQGTIELFQGNDNVETRNYGDEIVYAVKGEARTNLNFYKNNIIHLCCRDALLAAALMAAGDNRVPYQRLHDVCFLLSQLLKREFIYRPEDSFEEQLFEVLGRFVGSGWVMEHEDGSFSVEEDAKEIIAFFSNMIQNFIEGYSIALGHLEHLISGPQTEKEWTRSLQKHGNTLVGEGKLRWQESVSSDLFKNALSVLLELNYVTRLEEESSGRRRRAPVRMLRIDPGQLRRVEALKADLERARCGT